MQDEQKGTPPFKDLPLAERGRPWSAAAAKARVRTWAGADDGLTTSAIQKKWRDCFFWYDPSKPALFASYKLPFTDIVDGKLTAIPRGIFAAAGALLGARGGVDIPVADMPAVIRHVQRYYKKMGLPSPFKKSIDYNNIDDEMKDIIKLIRA